MFVSTQQQGPQVAWKQSSSDSDWITLMQQKTEQSTSSIGSLPHTEHSAHLGVDVVDDATFVQP